jgi:hypothetical protein
MHDQDIGHRNTMRDRGEVAYRVVAHFPVQTGVDGDAGRDQHERVAVGHRARGHLVGDVAVRAGTIVDHHRLAQRLGELRTDQSREDIGGPTRRHRDDHAYRPRRVNVRRVSRRRQRAGHRREQPGAHHE